MPDLVMPDQDAAKELRKLRSDLSGKKTVPERQKLEKSLDDLLTDLSAKEKSYRTLSVFLDDTRKISQTLTSKDKAINTSVETYLKESTIDGKAKSFEALCKELGDTGKRIQAVKETSELLEKALANHNSKVVPGLRIHRKVVSDILKTLPSPDPGNLNQKRDPILGLLEACLAKIDTRALEIGSNFPRP